VPRLDWSAVIAGMVAGTAIIIPSALLSLLFVDSSSSLNWALVFQFVILGGFGVAGFVSGRRRSDTPMLHGTYAALGCWIIVQTFGAVRRLSEGQDVAWASYPAVALLAATFGMAGGLLADWHRRRTRRLSAPDRTVEG
jgi:hypothetical protein